MGKIADVIRDGCSIPEQKRRKLLSLDEEFSTLESEIKTLKAENKDLQVEVNPLKRQVESLQERMKNFQNKESTHSDSLDDKAEKLLHAIADSDGHMPMYATGKLLGMSRAQTNYYFGLLNSMDYIVQTGCDMDDGHPTYGADQEGLNYLAKKGML